MGDLFAEVGVVLCHSRRTQLAIGFGVFFFCGILVLGQVLAVGIELPGPMAVLNEVVRENLIHRSDKAAWAALGGFALLAIKTYRKDRRRLFGI
jgi:hypothetical protein